MLPSSNSPLPSSSGVDGEEISEKTQSNKERMPLKDPIEESVMLLQKRVLPIRSRRGGPGVGNSDIDQTIIDAQRRAEENKPLIPTSSILLLVTDSSLVPEPRSLAPTPNEASGSASATVVLNQSYFDRPEVIKSFHDQATIETPSYVELVQEAVGGRLRARTDEEHIDTSDSAYIARHRKYETFEKRLRRREREKLTHEHHKLKNRIEQLRSLDAPAFGGKDAGERERKRQSMLTTAEELEERYRKFLPDPRQRNDKRHKTVLSDDEASMPQQPEKLTIKIRRSAAASIAHSPSPSKFSGANGTSHHKRKSGKGVSATDSSRTSPDGLAESEISSSRRVLSGRGGSAYVNGQLLSPDSDDIRGSVLLEVQDMDISDEEGGNGEPRQILHPVRNSDLEPLPEPDGDSALDEDEAFSFTRSSKRSRRDGDAIYRPGALVRASLRSNPDARKTKRSVEPFGVKMYAQSDHIVEYDSLVPAYVPLMSQSRKDEREKESEKEFEGDASS